MTFKTTYKNRILYVQNLNEKRRYENLPQHQNLKHKKKLQIIIQVICNKVPKGEKGADTKYYK